MLKLITIAILLLSPFWAISQIDNIIDNEYADEGYLNLIDTLYDNSHSILEFDENDNLFLVSDG